MQAVPNLPSFDLMGLKISVFDRPQLEDHIVRTIEARTTKVCFGYSLGYLALFKKLPDLYHKCNAFDLMVCDGRYFYLFARACGVPLRYEISIPFASRLMLELSHKHGFSVMIIGSTDETNAMATRAVRQQYPGAKVHEGRSGGQFSEEEQRGLVAYINDKKPDFLFIGASTPIKEDFAYRWKGALDVSFIVPFGGMIDGLAGKVKLVSPLAKKLGLATFVRFSQEPRRLFTRYVFIFSEVFFGILPLVFWHRTILRKKDFNLVEYYLKRAKA